MSQASLSDFGSSFQEKIFQALFTDRQWASQMCEVIKFEYFELKYTRFLVERLFSYHSKYKTFPTIEALVMIVKDDLGTTSDKILQSQVFECLIRMREGVDTSDFPFVKEKALDFCKQQAFKDALEQAVDLIATEKYDTVVDVVKKAMTAGSPATPGHNFFEDYEARFVKINRKPVPTGIGPLDAKGIMNGGLGIGELGIVVGNTGTGKSHFLVQLGAEALKVGLNVMHYTLELSEYSVGLRYDSYLCEVNSDLVVDSKDDVMKHYGGANGYGSLYIKEYPTGFPTIVTLKAHMDRLALKGFRPDVIIIDYADIMRSTRKFDSLRHELKLVYEQLRNLAMECKLPIWSASQANRSSANSDIVGLENMSEAYGKAMVADVILSISRKAEEKAVGTGRLFIAKNRAGRDGLVFGVKIDTAQSRFTVLSDKAQTLDEMRSSETDDFKQKIADKLKGLTKDKSLGIQSK